MPASPFAHSLALVAGLASLGAAGLAAADEPTRLPLDGERTLAGIDVACTGIGQTKNDPKWLAYPVRVEFADAQRAYLANEVVTVSKTKGGDPLFSLSCEGPWVLLKLAPGSTYEVEARLAERDTAPRSTEVKSPAHGQARFVITFPDAH